MADKTDGVRYSLFLTTVQCRPYAVLIDRKLSIFQIPVAGNKKTFHGSIFDGELVWQKTKDVLTQVFLIFDVIAYKGCAKIQHENYHARLAVIRNAFDLDGEIVSSPEDAHALAKKNKIICGGNAAGLSFQPKGCFPMNQLDTLLRKLTSLPYATDGLVFTPVQSPVETGTSQGVFKFKQNHTLDLEVRYDSENKPALFVGAGGNPQTATQRLPLNSLGWNFTLSPADFWTRIDALQSRMTDKFQPLIIECKLLVKDTGLALEFMAIRGDKLHPNAVRTVLATVKNVQENISLHELVEPLRSGFAQSTDAAASVKPASIPQPHSCRVADHGGATLASIVVGDSLDSRHILVD